MVLAKSKNAVGLGNSLMNDRFGKSKASNMHRASGFDKGAIQRTGQNGETYLTNSKKEAAWMKMRSVTEQGDLDEFLSTAELAGTDFTAEKMNNVKIIHKDQRNPYLLNAAEERAVTRKQNANKKRLTVPRRPRWDENTTPQELDEKERQSLLEWRRGLAELQESNDLLMTPFERNLEVWRQLWRVIERSDLVVQIVDARNPLLFRCDDLERYVKEVDKRKNNLLLVNKADMMTLEQRQAWAEYFVSVGINFRFFSAELAREMNEARGHDVDEEEDLNEDGQLEEGEAEEIIDPEVDPLTEEARKIDLQEEQEDAGEWTDEEEMDSEPPASSALSPEERTRILTTDELEELFLEHAPDVDDEEEAESRKTVIGLVGYPNVGKSSTINALIGAKKVSVSATPGKTKHFQTIHLSDAVVLCDCPGLVFPNFANTKGELVCSGVLPIDQLREYTGPAGLVAQRIPKAFLEALYGMKINTRAVEEGGTGVPTSDEMLRAYARARGFMTTGKGTADESRASRYILKDYVKGKLLFCHPPPSDPPIDAKYFNRELYNESHLPSKRRAHAALPLTDDMSTVNGSTYEPSLMDSEVDVVPLPPVQGTKTAQLDKRFFAPQGTSGHIKLPHQYQQQNTETGRQQLLSGRKARAMYAIEKDIDPSDVKLAQGGKKHFKGNKRKKEKVKEDDDY